MLFNKAKLIETSSTIKAENTQNIHYLIYTIFACPLFIYVNKDAQILDVLSMQRITALFVISDVNRETEAILSLG